MDLEEKQNNFPIQTSTDAVITGAKDKNLSAKKTTHLYTIAEDTSES